MDTNSHKSITLISAGCENEIKFLSFNIFNSSYVDYLYTFVGFLKTSIRLNNSLYQLFTMERNQNSVVFKSLVGCQIKH